MEKSKPALSNWVFLRGDGSPEIGMGHIYRLLAIAEYLESNCQIGFISYNSEIESILPEYVRFFPLENNVGNIEAELSQIKNIQGIKDSSIVVDSYTFKNEYFKKLKSLVHKLIYIDDLFISNTSFDIVVNHSIFSKKEDYTNTNNCTYLLGTKYALLRKEYLQRMQSITAPSPQSTFKTIFICFGGSDIHSFSTKMAEILSLMPEIKTINIVTGVFNQKNNISESIFQNPKIKFHQDISATKMIKVIEQSDLCISSASTISYEICALRKPLIIGFYAENQINLYNGLIDCKLGLGLGDLRLLSSKKIAAFLETYIKLDFESYIENQIKYFDGRSAERISNRILSE